jgi:uncharacterized damage-inducible protein DinB
MSEEALLQLLYGKGAHANPAACVEDMDARMASRRPEQSAFSVWQLLSHINFWMDYELRRMRGETPAYPEHNSESWPAESAPASETEWRNEVSRFTALLAAIATLARGSAEELARKVPVLDPKQIPESHTVQAILWQIVVHNSYHVGQIVLVRRALGAWPPRGGGDSW